MDNKRILVTGGAGFIGSNFVEFLVNNYNNVTITVLDKLTYAGNKENLSPVWNEIEFVRGDIIDRDLVSDVVEGKDIIINFAAESHVDRSINSSEPFIQSNIHGVQTLLETVKDFGAERFIQISTDEVYGSIEEGEAKEGGSLNPSSPYSASKAAADMLVNSFVVTHDVPAIIARPTNNYGPRQHPEKLIPKFITRAQEKKRLPVYGDGSNIRDWLFVKDTCRAIDLLMREGSVGDVYNIGAGNYRSNIEVTREILQKLQRPESLIEFVEDRKGHDERYAVDFSRIRSLGWKPNTSFEEGLDKTIVYYT